MAKKESLSLEQAQSKRKELVKDLLTVRLSLDPMSVTVSGGLPGLQRTLRSVNQRIAQLKQGK